MNVRATTVSAEMKGEFSVNEKIRQRLVHGAIRKRLPRPPFPLPTLYPYDYVKAEGRLYKFWRTKMHLHFFVFIVVVVIVVVVFIVNIVLLLNIL